MALCAKKGGVWFQLALARAEGVELEDAPVLLAVEIRRWLLARAVVRPGHTTFQSSPKGCTRSATAAACVFAPLVDAHPLPPPPRPASFMNRTFTSPLLLAGDTSHTQLSTSLAQEPSPGSHTQRNSHKYRKEAYAVPSDSGTWQGWSRDAMVVTR